MNDDGHRQRGRTTFRSFAVWWMLILAEVVHGMLRALLLVPMVGEFRSNQIGVLTGSVIIVTIAYVTIDWIGAKNTPKLLGIGSFWVMLTVGFELLFGRYVMGLSWARIGADYNLAAGGLMPLGLLVLFFSPMIAKKLPRTRRQASR